MELVSYDSTYAMELVSYDSTFAMELVFYELLNFSNTEPHIYQNATAI